MGELLQIEKKNRSLAKQSPHTSPQPRGNDRQAGIFSSSLFSVCILHNWGHTAHSTALFFNTVLWALSAHHCKSPPHSQWGSSIEHLWYALPLNSPPSIVPHCISERTFMERGQMWLSPGPHGSSVTCSRMLGQQKRDQNFSLSHPILGPCTTPQEREIA